MKKDAAHRLVRDFLESWKEEEWYEAVSFLAKDRFQSYRNGYYGRSVLIFLLTMLCLSAGFLGKLSLTAVVLALILAVYIGSKANQKAYKKFQSVLTQECDARQAALAFALLGEKKVGYLGKTPFSYDYMTATALYAGGFEQVTIEFMDTLYEQMSQRKQQSASVYLYYKNLRVKCLRHLGRVQEAAKEKAEIADYAARHPKCAKSSWYMQYCEIEKIYDGLALRAFHDIRQNAENFLAKAGSVYNRVTGHYLMYCIEKGTGNMQAAKEHADYVRQYGGGLALSAKVE